MTRMPSTQKRCGVCNCILSEGVCVYGCNPADAAPAASPGPVQDVAMPASRYVPLDTPVFSEEQRRHAAANMEERIRAQSARSAAPSSGNTASASSASSSGGHALSATAAQGGGPVQTVESMKRAAPSSDSGAAETAIVAHGAGRKKRRSGSAPDVTACVAAEARSMGLQAVTEPLGTASRAGGASRRDDDLAATSSYCRHSFCSTTVWH